MAGQQTRGARRSGNVDTSGRPTKSDERARRQAARGRDAPLEAAYKAGQTGQDRHEALSLLASDSDYSVQDLEGYFDSGASDARGASRRARLEGAGAKAADKGLSVANDGAGVLLGVLIYALLFGYLRCGMPGVKGWLSAKFINKPNPELRACMGRYATAAAVEAGAAGAAAGAAGVRGRIA